MRTIEEKKKLHNRAQFEEDYEGYLDTYEGKLLESVDTAISEGTLRYDGLEKMYEQYFRMEKPLNEGFKKDFRLGIHTLKGQAKICYIECVYQPGDKLEKAIVKNQYSDIDKYIYEVFSLKRQYFECLYAMKGENKDEPEFDLRKFDAFTHLNFAPVYQALPVNAQSITFNNLAHQSALPVQNEGEDQKATRVLISEKITLNNKPYKLEEIVEKYQSETNSFQVIRGIVAHSDERSVYYQPAQGGREQGQALYSIKRGANYTDDYPYEQGITCQIF